MTPIGPAASWPRPLDAATPTRGGRPDQDLGGSDFESYSDAVGSFESTFAAIENGRPVAASAAGGPLEQLASIAAGEIGNVNRMQHDADAGVHSLLTGGDVNEAEVLTGVQKADLAFRMLLQVRNKLMDAYREIQQIQI